MRHANDDAATSCIVLWMLLRATGSRPWDTAANLSSSRARSAKCGFATCPTTYWAQTWRPAATHRWCSGMALYLASREQTTPPVRLRVHAGGPEPPPLGANSAVATTSTSPSPALAHSPAHALSHLFRLVAPSRSSHLSPRTLVFILLSHRPRGTQAAHTIMSTRQRTSGSHLGYTPAQGPAMGLVPGATRAPQIEAT